MGSCSCCSGGEEKQDVDLSGGPVKDRGCTDIVWIPILIAAQVIFLIVTIAGMADGNPTKLYAPRDFMGAYCGVETNWNNGPNLVNTPTLSYTMNVTSTVDLMMKQLVCSPVAAKALTEGDSSLGIAALLTTQAERDDYLCDCCLSPCSKCTGSYDMGELLTDPTRMSEVISGKLSELTDPSKAADLFSTSGFNADMFSTEKFWSAATAYFNLVCLPSCATDYTSISNASDVRSFTYTPTRDSELWGIWNTLENAPSSNSLATALKNTITSSFTFQAYPLSMCPYDPQYCVPFPGMTYGELAGSADYCSFAMATEVVDAIGDVAASAFESLGITALGEASVQEFGKWAGDFQKTLDTFIIVSVLSFTIGLVFLVVLRFTIGICVWIAIALTVLMFFFGGAFIFVLSVQCKGADLLSTGTQTAVAAAIAGTTAISNAATGTEVSEELTGNGADYRGVQKYTKLGLSCLNWDTQTRMSSYNSNNYPILSHNYCRNPYGSNDTDPAATIWCITSDESVIWQECLPIGVITPECKEGYAVDGQEMRDALYYSSFVIWVLGVIWLIVILCFIKRINLAIALNKVAAVFLGTNPHILLIPIVQALIGIIWTLLWFFGASFLLSQVPDSYTPTGSYATYAEAYGTLGDCTTWDTLSGSTECTAAVPGACTDQWPTGSVWKTNDCEVIDGIVKCWRCSQPRYALDIRFAISFFVFLWNNAFNVAMGQALIAMAVCTWFFTPNSEKGKMSSSVLGSSVKTIFRYHIGSIAFGSFIVAVVEFIRYLMKYFEKQAAAQKNKIMVYILKCVQCCIWCFEKCIKFLNKNAYIQIALLGKNFCTSARAAFFLIARNVLRFGTIAALSGIVHGIGFMCIMVGTTTIGFFLVEEMHPDISPFMPCLCFMFMSYVVAKLFMNVFGLAVDTSLQCFIATEESGSGGDFVPSVLSDFVNSEETQKAAKELDS